MVWDEGNKQRLQLLRKNDAERTRAAGKENYKLKVANQNATTCSVPERSLTFESPTVTIEIVLQRLSKYSIVSL